MPQTPIRSACGSRGSDSTFSSTIVTSQSDGQSAARVASPSGGLIVRFVRGSTRSTAQRKLQKLSG